jgi:hypothetical protein
MERGTYPGYRAEKCNGCGLCCLTAPCSISQQFGLWRHGRCIALQSATDGVATRYFCGVLTAPATISKRLAALTQEARDDAIGVGRGCDHRAAWSIQEAVALLQTRNIADDYYKFAGDSYPRGCVLHTPDGRHWLVYQGEKGAEPTVSPMGLSTGIDVSREVPLSQWIDRGGVR